MGVSCGQDGAELLQVAVAGGAADGGGSGASLTAFLAFFAKIGACLAITVGAERREPVLQATRSRSLAISRLPVSVFERDRATSEASFLGISCKDRCVPRNHRRRRSARARAARDAFEVVDHLVFTFIVFIVSIVFIGSSCLAFVYLEYPATIVLTHRLRLDVFNSHPTASGRARTPSSCPQLRTMEGLPRAGSARRCRLALQLQAPVLLCLLIQVVV